MLCSTVSCPSFIAVAVIVLGLYHYPLAITLGQLSHTSWYKNVTNVTLVDPFSQGP